MAISRGFQARLSKLYKEAPDDVQLPNIDTDTWDDDELLREGRELDRAEEGSQGVSELVALSWCRDWHSCCPQCE